MICGKAFINCIVDDIDDYHFRYAAHNANVFETLWVPPFISAVIPGSVPIITTFVWRKQSIPQSDHRFSWLQKGKSNNYRSKTVGGESGSHAGHVLFGNPYIMQRLEILCITNRYRWLSTDPHPILRFYCFPHQFSKGFAKACLNSISHLFQFFKSLFHQLFCYRHLWLPTKAFSAKLTPLPLQCQE